VDEGEDTVRRRLTAAELRAGDRIGSRRVAWVDACEGIVTVALADRAPRRHRPQISVCRYVPSQPLTVARSGAWDRPGTPQH
jgi:hypothetical protein